MAKKKQEAEKQEYRHSAMQKKWGNAVRLARAIRSDWIVIGDDVHRVVSGEADTETYRKMREKFGEMPSTERYTPWPKMSGFVNSLISVLLRQNARVRVRPTDPLDRVAVGRAACDTAFLASVATTTRRNEEMRIAGYDALVYGVGAMLHEYDEHNKSVGCRSILVDDLLLDPHGRAAPSSMAWRGYEQTIPLELARKQYKNPDLQPNVVQGRRTEKLDPNQVARWQMIDEENQRRFRIVVIYERAGVPLDGSMKMSDVDTKPNEDGGYSGRDRKLTFNAETFELLEEGPWGFTLERGEFPITLITPTIDPRNAWAYSALAPIKRLQYLLDFFMSVAATEAANASRKLVGINSQGAADAETLKSDIAGRKQLVGYLTNGNPDGIVNQQPLGELSATQLKMLEIAGGAFDEASNRPGLMSSQGTEYATATGAEVAQRRTNASIGVYAGAFEIAIGQLSVKDLQVGHSTMTGEETYPMVGSKIGTKTEAVGTDGKPVITYEFWPEDMTLRELRSIDVFVSPNSTLETSNAERARTILELGKVAIEAIGVGKNLGLQVDTAKMEPILSTPPKLAASLLDVPELEEVFDRNFPGLFMPAPPQPQTPEEMPVTQGQLMPVLQQIQEQSAMQMQQMGEQFAQALQQMQQVNMQQGEMIAQLGQTVAALAKEVQGMGGVVMATAERSVDKDVHGDTVMPSGANVAPQPTVPPGVM